jgi:hypothetical protein
MLKKRNAQINQQSIISRYRRIGLGLWKTRGLLINVNASGETVLPIQPRYYSEQNLRR